MIYPVDSVIHLSNNRGQVINMRHMGSDPNQVGISLYLSPYSLQVSCIIKGILKENLHVSNIPNMAVFTSSILYNTFNADFSNAKAMDSH